MLLIWLVIALLAVVGEVLTTGLFLASIAVAAAITAVLAVLVPFLAVQVVVFAVLSLVGIALVRPFVVRTLGIESLASLGGPVSHSHLVGRRAVAMQQIDAAGGQIRIGQSEFWTARPYNPDAVIPAGTPVEVLLVEGLTALVAPLEPALGSPQAELPASTVEETKGT